MIISKITPAAKTPGRYNIFIDGQYSFSLDELQLLNEKLSVGLGIDANRLAELKGESEFGKNYLRALDLISRRPRSEREIRDYGYRKQWSQANIDRVVKRLYDKKYLNDADFAERFARSRLQSNKYSKKRIRLELKRKGITDDIIERVLHDEINDQGALDKLIAKRYHHYDSQKKLVAYLLRNGFDYDSIISAIARYKAAQEE